MNKNHSISRFAYFLILTTIFIAMVLSCTAYYLSYKYLEREDSRSLVFQRQLKSIVDIETRRITEESYTQSYAAVNKRIGDIASQFGSKEYQLAILAPNFDCLYFAKTSEIKKNCDEFKNELIESKQSDTNPSINTNGILYIKKSNDYFLQRSMNIGPIAVGTLLIAIKDPYLFDVTTPLEHALNVFLLPLLLSVALVLCWAIFSWKFFLKPTLQDIVENDKQRAVAKLASRVAHDIQSPIEVLKNLVDRSQNRLLSSEREMLTGVVNRVKHLTSDLLQIKGETKRIKSNSLSFITPIIRLIVDEKKIISKVKINCEIEDSLITCASTINQSDLSRILSNILNNSIDALSDTNDARIHISVYENSIDSVIVKITDNGCGMSQSTLDRVISVGGSFKKHGSGIGLTHAKEVVSACGGKLSIESVLNSFTTVQLELPKADTAQNFISLENIPENKRLILIDDDPNLYDRFRGLFPSRSVVWIADPNSFDPHSYTFENDFFIVDYDFCGTLITGVDVILSNQIKAHSVLCTHYYNDTEVQELIKRENIKLLPKFLISENQTKTVSTEVELLEDYPCLVLIDDDPLIRMMWEMVAKEKGLNIKVFNEFNLGHFNDVQFHTPIFVDLNLANGQSGIEVINQLASVGFKKLFIASGESEPPENTPQNISGFLGKDFPPIELIQN